MTQFRGKFTNRLDGKGRVSVPATFRGRLAGQPLVLRRSTRHPCLEAWPAEAFDADAPQAGPLDEISPADDALAYAMFADTLDVVPDHEGRMILPRELRDFAGIDGAVTFMGRLAWFELWEPAAAEAMIEAARQAVVERAKARAAGVAP
jgi:MraZ protein